MSCERDSILLPTKPASNDDKARVPVHMKCGIYDSLLNDYFSPIRRKKWTTSMILANSAILYSLFFIRWICHMHTRKDVNIAQLKSGHSINNVEQYLPSYKERIRLYSMLRPIKQSALGTMYNIFLLFWPSSVRSL